jgi:spermidine synthase
MVVWAFNGIVFSLGMYAAIAQVLLLRELLVVLYGNELCLGTILGVWLLGVSLGASIGGEIGTRSRYPHTLFLLILALMTMILPIAIIILRSLRIFIDVPRGTILPFVPMLLICLAIIVPVSINVGLSFPFAAKARMKLKEEKGSAAKIYAIEAIGAMIGGIIFTFFMAGKIQTGQVLGIIACVVLSFVIIYYFCLNFRSRGIKVAIGILSLSSLLVFPSLGRSFERKSQRLRWKSYGHTALPLLSYDSKYQHLDIERHQGQYNLYANGKYVLSFPDPYTRRSLIHLFMIQHPNPQNVLLLGGGISDRIGAALLHNPKKIDYVELDPKMIEICLPFLSKKEKKSLKDPRVRIIYEDGRKFLKEIGQKTYDLIIVDVPDPSNQMINRFYTIEFYKEVKRVLKKDGVFITGGMGGLHYMAKEAGVYAGSLYHTLRKIFAWIILLPDVRAWYFSSLKPGITTDNISILKKRWQQRKISSPYFSEHLLSMFFHQERIRKYRSYLQSRSFPLNKDSKPITYYLNLILWDVFTEVGEDGSGLGAGKMLRLFSKVKIWWFLVLFLAYLCLRFIFRKGIGLQFDGLMVIGSAGFMGMSLEILVIFAYQNIYGCLYEDIGLLFAVFMGGLTLGTFIFERLRKRFINLGGILNWVFFLELICILVIIISFWGIWSWGRIRGILFLLNGLFGFLTGASFPLAFYLHIGLGRDLTRAAGEIDSADHVGGVLGALLMGSLVVPVMGVRSAIILILSLKVTSILGLLIRRFL